MPNKTLARIVCLECGMPKKDWSGNNGEGILKDGRLYCCEGCLDESGCIC